MGPTVVAEPIEADVAATQQLQVPLNIAEIRVLDYLLVSEQDVVSLSERQLMGLVVKIGRLQAAQGASICLDISRVFWYKPRSLSPAKTHTVQRGLSTDKRPISSKTRQHHV